jgi:hypothetical protein
VYRFVCPRGVTEEELRVGDQILNSAEVLWLVSALKHARR